jgi:hypothetical protein
LLCQDESSIRKRRAKETGPREFSAVSWLIHVPVMLPGAAMPHTERRTHVRRAIATAQNTAAVVARAAKISTLAPPAGI